MNSKPFTPIEIVPLSTLFKNREQIYIKIEDKENKKNEKKLMTLEDRSLIAISGDGGSGRTQFSFYLAVQTSCPKRLGGLEKGVLYLSSKKFPYKRLENFFDDIDEEISQKEADELSKRFVIKENIDDFKNLIMNDITKLIEKYNIKTVIINSFTAFIDSEVMNMQDLSKQMIEKRKFIDEVLKHFTKLCAKYGLFAIFVTDEPKKEILDDDYDTKFILQRSQDLANKRILKTRYNVKWPTLHDLTFIIHNNGISFIEE